MERMMRAVRWFLVIVGVVLLTSFTVDATIGGGGFSQSALGILARNIEDTAGNGCPVGMVRLGGEFDKVCVDVYEASPGNICPEREVSNVVATQRNVATRECVPQSEKDAVPWTYVSQHQAQELCARAGKRLLSNAEWYRATVGTPDLPNESLCHIAGDSPLKTGASNLCVSGVGVYDGIGNVWEWVDGQVENATYKDRPLPQSGYVAEADQDGVVTRTEESPQADFHEDYFWTSESGVFGMLRGGAHGSKDDAGTFSLQAKTPLSFAGGAVGFRCGFDIRS